DISNNQLSGPLPDSATLPIVLESLGLGGNNLTGPISPVFGMRDKLYYFNISGSGLTCPADGSECGVKQSNASSFCRLCFSFCSSCTPLKWAAPTAAPAPAAAPESTSASKLTAAPASPVPQPSSASTQTPPAPPLKPASRLSTLTAAAFSLFTAAALTLLAFAIREAASLSLRNEKSPAQMRAKRGRQFSAISRAAIWPMKTWCG
ncbi:unnamed protein product, partial [Closterium sp. NIES-54]